MKLHNENNTQETKGADQENIDQTPMQKLEDALVICRFGRFNILLLVTTFFSVLATTSVTTATSYILPSAECDLNMTMMQKGILNAIPFLGHFCASMFTGFAVDAFGRKILLVGGNFGLFLSALLGALSQSYPVLLFGKLLEGIVMSLVFTATSSMVAEFTHKSVRDRVLMTYASFMSMSVIVAALVAWALLPSAWRFVVVEGYFVINSWNIYLFLSACWSLLAASLYWQFPESPKFLLSQGDEKQTLVVLKTIYRINTGNPEESFPLLPATSFAWNPYMLPWLNSYITKRVSFESVRPVPISGDKITTLGVRQEYKRQSSTISLKKQFTNGLFQTKELFRTPLLCHLILFSCTTIICLLAYSAMRLWFPQISTIVENHQKEYGAESMRFCVVLDAYTAAGRNATANDLMNANISEAEICVPRLAGTETYTNGIILGMVSFVSILFSSYLVDFFGQKPLMVVFLIMCAACSGALYWTNSSIQIAILISATCAFVQTVFSLQHSILVRVFPTTVRTMALSIVIMFGRIGSLVGNILFPVMLEMGCMVPFLTLSAVTLCTAGLVYFLPNPRKENSRSGDK